MMIKVLFNHCLPFFKMPSRSFKNPYTSFLTGQVSTSCDIVTVVYFCKYCMHKCVYTVSGESKCVLIRVRVIYRFT